VKFNLQFATLATVTNGTISNTPVLGASLYVDYIYLDTDERRQFAQVQHEYLIEQLQFTGAETVSGAGAYKSKLALNHPCKELVWVHHLGGNQPSDFSDSSADTVTDAKLQLNGQDRFSTRPGSYFNLVQPYQHHTRIPSVGIYVYSFALNPEAHQPSGTVNMSRIDNATLQLTLSAAGSLHVYAVNYNVLRVMAGMGGLNKMGQKVNFEKKFASENYVLIKKLFFATLSNCGKLLIAFTTTFIWKHLRGPRLIVDPNGKNVKDWIIRSQVPYRIISGVKVQRLNVSGEFYKNFLRYSLVPKIKYIERWGINVLIVIKLQIYKNTYYNNKLKYLLFFI
jgi:hypothetical protein